MTKNRVYTAIGLMSGTSLDGVDAALIETDGRSQVRTGPMHYLPYPENVKDQVRVCFGKVQRDAATEAAANAVTDMHIRAVKEFLARENITPDIIGFHGQTVTHKPKEGFTWQLGDGKRLAIETGVNVVDQFRIDDVKAGGEGAPLIPLYHQALARAKNLKMPTVFLNIGGVSNVTWIGEQEDDILAFDTGPGNALMDDFMKQSFGQAYDANGIKAKEGVADKKLLSQWMEGDYLKKTPPKSLDRGFLPDKDKQVNADMNVWDVSDIWSLKSQDAMATLNAFTAKTIAAAQAHFPQKPHEWYVCGGGRHNKFLMELIAREVDAPVKAIDELGYNGDAIEAEGFAYLAIRHLENLPLSLPTTTGVKAPCKGGRFHAA